MFCFLKISILFNVQICLVFESTEISYLFLNGMC